MRTIAWVVGEPDAAEMPPARRQARDEPVDVAFEVAGDDDALSDAIAAVRPGGQVVLVGIPDGDRSSFPAGEARRKEVTLRLARRMAATDLARAIALAEVDRVELASLISHRYPLDAAPAAFETLASRRGLKVVVNPTSGVPAGERR